MLALAQMLPEPLLTRLLALRALELVVTDLPRITPMQLSLTANPSTIPIGCLSEKQMALDDPM